MPKHIPETVKKEVYRLVAESQQKGLKLPSVDRLARMTGLNSTGRTTLWKFRKEALDNIKQTVPLDPPWNPSPMEWEPEAYSFLLALNRHCVLGVERTFNNVMPILESSRLTAREAKWGARLYSALKDAPFGLAYHVVNMFASRETAEKVYDYPTDFEDLVGFLEYKPWESPEANENYELACQLGRVPRMGITLTSTSEETGEIDSGVVRIKQTGEITPDLHRSLADIDAMLSAPDRKNWQDLQIILERARLITRVAEERIYAFWESRKGEE